MQGHNTYIAVIFWLFAGLTSLFAEIHYKPDLQKGHHTGLHFSDFRPESYDNSSVAALVTAADSRLGAYNGAGSIEEGIAQLQQAIFAFDFARADSICQYLETQYPGHYLIHFARAHYTWWLIITMPESAELEKVFRDHIGKSLRLATSGNAKNNDNPALFYLISLHATQARLDVKNGAYIKAVRNGRHAISYIEQSRGREHEYEGFLLTSGLYNYMTIQASRKYPFLKVYTLFYPEGDKLRGLDQLRLASESNNYVLKTEAHYFLMRIWLDMENTPAYALPHATWLTTMHPENLIYQYYHLLTLKAMHDERAVQARKEVMINAVRKNSGISSMQKDYFTTLLNEI